MLMCLQEDKLASTLATMSSWDILRVGGSTGKDAAPAVFPASPPCRRDGVIVREPRRPGRGPKGPSGPRRPELGSNDACGGSGPRGDHSPEAHGPGSPAHGAAERPAWSHGLRYARGLVTDGSVL